MRRHVGLSFLLWIGFHGLLGQSVRSFALVHSRNPEAKAQLPWFDLGDSIRNEAVNRRIWVQMLYGYQFLEAHWADSTCSSLLLDVHDTMYGLQDAITRIIWQNDSLITFETHAEWLGVYSSQTLHRATVNKQHGLIQFDADADFDARQDRYLIMQTYHRKMLRYRKRAMRRHIREFKKLSNNDRTLLDVIRMQCEGMPWQPEMWRDARGLCISLDCELPHAFAAWNKEITFVIQEDSLP
jgi:hypothetical protein